MSVSAAGDGPGRRRRRVTALRSVVLLAAAALAVLLSLPELRLMLAPRGGGGGGGRQALGGRQREEAPAPLRQEFPLPKGFRHNKVVAIVAFDRYEYFRQVIDALQRAWGSEQYTVAITVDGPPANETAFDRHGWEAILEYSRHLQWLSQHGHGFREVLLNASETNLGLWPNKKRAVGGAMALSDFVIVLEDDIVLERDALRWFEWHVTSGLIFRRKDLAVATCWGASFPAHANVVDGHDRLAVHELGLLDKYWINHWATPWGWATWKRTWDALGEAWTGQDLKLAYLLWEHDWFETMPLVSRCNNIGSFGTNRQRSGHVHERALTSASFRNLDRCRYTELARPNNTQHIEDSPLYQVVRHGIGKHDVTFTDRSLGFYQKALRQFVREDPNPKRYRSTC